MDPGVLTVKEDLGFGQEGEKEEKITVAEYDVRQTMKEVQKVRYASVLQLPSVSTRLFAHILLVWLLLFWCLSSRLARP